MIETKRETVLFKIKCSLGIILFLVSALICEYVLSGAPEDGSEVIWKAGFDSFYTEITELGRYGYCVTFPFTV